MSAPADSSSLAERARQVREASAIFGNGARYMGGRVCNSK